MNQIINLSDGEWKLMNLLWDHAPRTVTELVHAVAGDTGWTKHTIIKMLSRMEEKGAVRHEEGARAKQFYPAADRRTAVLGETKSFLRKVYGGSIGLMMSAMVEENALSPQELDQLYDILRKAEEGEGHDR